MGLEPPNGGIWADWAQAKLDEATAHIEALRGIYDDLGDMGFGDEAKDLLSMIHGELIESLTQGG